MLTSSRLRPSLRFSSRAALVRVVLSLAAILLLAPGPADAAAASTRGEMGRPGDGALGPLDLVKASMSRLRAIAASGTTAEDRRVEIRRVAHDLFDFDEMASRALGRHWRDLASPAQAEFSRRFTYVVERAYVAAAEAYAGRAVVFQPEKVAGGYADVRSRMTTEYGAPITIGYHLAERDSQWAVYDVVLDGVSLVSNYRSQFNSIIRTSSMAQLLERMPADGSTSTEGMAEGSRGAQVAPSQRERLAAGLFVVMTASRRR